MSFVSWMLPHVIFLIFHSDHPIFHSDHPQIDLKTRQKVHISPKDLKKFKFNKIFYFRLDGQTPVQDRQALIDKFNKDTSIFVFILSTKYEFNLLAYRHTALLSIYPELYFYLFIQSRGTWNQPDGGQHGDSSRPRL